MDISSWQLVEASGVVGISPASHSSHGLVVTGRRSGVVMWEVIDRKALRSWASSPSSELTIAATQHPNRTLFAVMDRSRLVRWNDETAAAALGALVSASHACSAPVHSLRCSPRLPAAVVVISSTGAVSLHDVTTLAQLASADAVPAATGAGQRSSSSSSTAAVVAWVGFVSEEPHHQHDAAPPAPSSGSAPSLVGVLLAWPGRAELHVFAVVDSPVASVTLAAVHAVSAPSTADATLLSATVEPAMRCLSLLWSDASWQVVQVASFTANSRCSSSSTDTLCSPPPPSPAVAMSRHLSVASMVSCDKQGAVVSPTDQVTVASGVVALVATTTTTTSSSSAGKSTPLSGKAASSTSSSGRHTTVATWLHVLDCHQLLVIGSHQLTSADVNARAAAATTRSSPLRCCAARGVVSVATGETLFVAPISLVPRSLSSALLSLSTSLPTAAAPPTLRALGPAANSLVTPPASLALSFSALGFDASPSSSSSAVSSSSSSSSSPSAPPSDSLLAATRREQEVVAAITASSSEAQIVSLLRAYLASVTPMDRKRKKERHHKAGRANPTAPPASSPSSSSSSFDTAPKKAKQRGGAVLPPTPEAAATASSSTSGGGGGSEVGVTHISSHFVRSVVNHCLSFQPTPLFAPIHTLASFSPFPLRLCPLLLPAVMQYHELPLLEMILSYFPEIPDGQLVDALDYALDDVNGERLRVYLAAKPTFAGVQLDARGAGARFVNIITTRPTTSSFLTAHLRALPTPHVLALLAHLHYWHTCYLVHGAVLPAELRAAALRVPSHAQVLQWLALVLEAHLTTLMLLPAARPLLLDIQRVNSRHIKTTQRSVALKTYLHQMMQRAKRPSAAPTADNLDEYSVQMVTL